MDEIELKNRIKSAFPMEAVPAELVERTIQRGKAIMDGRAAEAEMEAGNGNRMSFARAAAGRLMMMQEMPNGMDAEKLSTGLSKQVGYDALSVASSDLQMQSLKNGKFLTSLVMSHSQEMKPETVLLKAAEKGVSEKEAPLKEPPVKQATQNLPGI